MDSRALDYVMGALTPEGRAAVGQDRRVDPALDGAIRTLEDQLAPLTGLAGEVTPPARLFDRIQLAIEGEAGARSETLEEGQWRPYRPGIQAKRMWNRRTLMLRCEAGSVIPAHDHGEDEHLIVVSGDFIVGGVSHEAGDYLFSPKGSRHGDGTTRDGCLLLVRYARAGGSSELRIQGRGGS